MNESAGEIRGLETAKDVTPEILSWAEHVFEDWFDDDEPIDWEKFVDKLADPDGYRSEGAEPFDIYFYDNAAIRKIQRHIRAYKNQG